jgi:hypothetical protein
MARIRIDGPNCATAAAIAACSAHEVNRYDAFSTFVPATIIPAAPPSERNSTAAPTRNPLYGEYELCAAALAHSWSAAISPGVRSASRAMVP